MLLLHDPQNALLWLPPDFVDRPAGDFRLKGDSPAFDLGFQAIPFDRIGLAVDHYRKQLP